MDVAGYTGEFLVLEYADGDKLYVPVQALHLVSRYTGAPAETAPLHKLGGEQWQKARRKAAQRIRDVAAELLDLYSRRAAREGTLHGGGRGRLPRHSRRAFRFEETADQAAAIDQVLARPEVRQAHGPGDLRRRRLRQDRGRFARRVRRRARPASRWRCSCRPRCSPSSTTRLSSIASPIGRYASKACRASAPARRPRR